MRVLGIMSGTSLDGVDYALCEVSRSRIALEKLWSAPFPAALRTALHRAAVNKATSHEVGQLSHDLGRFYAASVPPRIKPELVGLHGQTIFHSANPKRGASLQIGEPAYLCERLRVPVVSNFRAADIAAGGQGAPLATLFHKVVFGQRGKHICVNNLGGISNVTSIDWTRGKDPRLLAFDTGPGNMLIDQAVNVATSGRSNFDRNGNMAAKGSASEPLLTRWMAHPFFKAKPPKSTGREMFGTILFEKLLADCRSAKLSNEDTVATFTELTARSIALNYQLHLRQPPSLVIVCGGGANNIELLRRLAAQLRTESRKVEVKTCEDFGWPAASVEPAAFALLAYYRWKKWPGNLPATTGARRPALLGQVAEP